MPNRNFVLISDWYRGHDFEVDMRDAFNDVEWGRLDEFTPYELTRAWILSVTDIDMRLHGLYHKQWLNDKYMSYIRIPWKLNEALDFTISRYRNHKHYSESIQNGALQPDKVAQCNLCGTIYLKGAITSLDTKTYGHLESVCPTCRGELIPCMKCGNEQPGIDTLRSVNGQWICESCYEVMDTMMCALCNNHFTHGYLHEDEENDMYVCEGCWSTRTQCSRCDRHMYANHDMIYMIDGEMVCHYCYVPPDRIVARYDYFDNDPEFMSLTSERIRSDTLLFGCEHEIEVDWARFVPIDEEDIGRMCLEGVPKSIKGYAKHDGSMSYGVEFVTNPMTENYYKAHKHDYTAMLKAWSDAGFRTDQFDTNEQRYNCGLHVHMSKAAFHPLHLHKFVQFFYKIHMRPFIQQVAGRNANDFAKYKREDYQHLKKVAKYKENISGDRYSVINLIGGHWHEENEKDSPTVEFRLFKGTVDPHEFHKDIEFLLSVYRFTRDTSITHISERNYLRFLNNTRNRYSHLIDFLNTELKKGI